MTQAIKSKHLILKGYWIDHFEYNFTQIGERKDAVYIPEYNYDLQITEQNEEVHFWDGTFKYTLKIIAHAGEKRVLMVTLSMSSIFTTEKEMDQKEFEELCKDLGLPNMFQIARAIIASATSVMGGNPLIIPLTNLSISERQAKSKRKEAQHDKQESTK